MKPSLSQLDEYRLKLQLDNIYSSVAEYAIQHYGSKPEYVEWDTDYDGEYNYVDGFYILLENKVKISFSPEYSEDSTNTEWDFEEMDDRMGKAYQDWFYEIKDYMETNCSNCLYPFRSSLEFDLIVVSAASVCI